MAKISTYPFATPPTLGSYVIGTLDVFSKETKNFRISDVLALSGAGLFVPYTGATTDVDLGSYSLTSDSFINPNGDSDGFLKADGSIDTTSYVTVLDLSDYVPYIGATSNLNLGTRTITANSIIKVSGLPSQFLKADGSVDSNSYLTTSAASTAYVPYTGAVSNISLGLKSLSGFDITASNSLNANGPFKVSGNAGLAGQILVSVGPGGAPVWQNHDTNYNYGLFAQTAKSGIVTFATGEQSLIGTGVGILSVPPNGFKVGDSFTSKMCGPVTCANNQGLRFRVRTNGIVLIDTGVINMPSTTSKIFDLILDFTITKLGINGIAEIFANGAFTYNKDASNAIEGTNIGLINNTTFNTEITNTLTITAEWVGTNALNAIQSQNFTLNKIY